MGRADGGRRALQVTASGLAVIPLVSGGLAVVVGPAALPGGPGAVSVSMDSEYRFVSTIWAALAPVIWSQVGKIDDRAPALDATLAIVFVGGLARVRSWQATGRPHPVFVGAAALELVGMPVIAAWRRRLRRLAQGSAALRG